MCVCVCVCVYIMCVCMCVCVYVYIHIREGSCVASAAPLVPPTSCDRAARAVTELQQSCGFCRPSSPTYVCRSASRIHTACQ